MKIKHWIHERVLEDGTCLDEFGNINGHVNIEKSISMSPDNGGCGLKNCKCSEGHWLSVCFGMDFENKTVSGITVYFDNWGEMALFLSTRKVSS